MNLPFNDPKYHEIKKLRAWCERNDTSPEDIAPLLAGKDFGFYEIGTGIIICSQSDALLIKDAIDNALNGSLWVPKAYIDQDALETAVASVMLKSKIVDIGLDAYPICNVYQMGRNQNEVAYECMRLGQDQPNKRMNVFRLRNWAECRGLPYPGPAHAISTVRAIAARRIQNDYRYKLDEIFMTDKGYEETYGKLDLRKKVEALEAVAKSGVPMRQAPLV